MKTVRITELDSGYFIEHGQCKHAFTSKNEMLEKIIEIFKVVTFDKPDEPPAIKEPVPITEEILQPIPIQKEELEPIIRQTGHETYGILTDQPRGTFPIKQSDFLVPEMISIPNNQKVTFGETYDKRLLLEYGGAKVYTTWTEICNMVDSCHKGQESEAIPFTLIKNKRTAIRQFMIAVRNGLKPRSSVELDPDKDFRSILNRASTHEYERGTLESVEAD